MGPVSDVADKHGDDSSDGIRRDGQQLGFGRRVAQIFDDGGDEQTECVQHAVAAHVHDHSGVRLPVLHNLPQIDGLELLVLRAALLIRGQATQDSCSLVGREESCLVGEIVYEEEAGYADKEC